MAELEVRRIGPRRYTGHNERGAVVEIGSQGVAGTFTPGELLKIALGGCTGLSTDIPLARRLGDDYTSTITISGDADRDKEVYVGFDEKLQVDLSVLTEEEKARLLQVLHSAVDRVCTVGRTLKSGTQVTLDIVETSVSLGNIDSNTTLGHT